MRAFICCVALLSAVTLSASAQAQETPAAVAAPAVKAGNLLKSSDGKRVGRIERVVTAKDGSPVSASVIVDSRFVYVPVSTISASAEGFVTSLSRAEVRKLN